MKKFYAMNPAKFTGANVDTGINGVFGPLQTTQFRKAPSRAATSLGGQRAKPTNTNQQGQNRLNDLKYENRELFE